MRHYHVQTIVETYENPVDLCSDVLSELTAFDIFSSPAASVHDLEKTCAMISGVCRNYRFKNMKKKKSSQTILAKKRL